MCIISRPLRTQTLSLHSVDFLLHMQELGKTGLTVGGFREILLHSFAFLSSVRYRDMPVKSNCGEGVTQREKQRQPRQGCSSVTAREVCVFTGGTTQQSAVSVLRVGVRYSYLQKILNNISKR